MKIAYLKIDEIRDSLILKPNYHLNYGKLRIAKALSAGISFCKIGDITESIYSGGIFKRIFVENSQNGIPYISGQNILDSNPLDSAKLISRKFTPRQKDMILYENQILVSCAGSVGNVRLITDDLKGVIGSQDIIRVVYNDSKSPYGFIYGYLASPTAYNYIQSFIYGSVVPRIDANTFANLPVPQFPKAKQKEIHNLIVKSAESRVKGNNILASLRNEVQKILECTLENISFKTNKSSTISIKSIKQYEQRFDAPYYAEIGRTLYDAIISKKHVRLSTISEVFLPILFGKK
jgi:type I restriction enzyme, S subunit